MMNVFKWNPFPKVRSYLLNLKYRFFNGFLQMHFLNQNARILPFNNVILLFYFIIFIALNQYKFTFSFSNFLYLKIFIVLLFLSCWIPWFLIFLYPFFLCVLFFVSNTISCFAVNQIFLLCKIWILLFHLY